MPLDSGNQASLRLTDPQSKALPFIIASPTYTEDCRRAKVDRKTFHDVVILIVES